MDAERAGSSARHTRRSRSHRRTVTIKDVAQLSGVSAATVTRALQGYPRVRPETRRRVVDAAARLGYRPDHAARTLVTGMSRTIGLLIPTIGDSYWAEVAEGIEQRAAELDFSVLLGSGHGDVLRASRMLDVFYSKRVDGIVVATSAGAAGPVLGAATQTPAVIVGWDPPVAAKVIAQAATDPPRQLVARLRRRRARLAHVAFDDSGAGELAVSHLLDLGHQRIAFLGGPATLATALRLVGGRRRLADAGLDFEHVLTGADTYEDARAAARELLGRAPGPTAVVAFNDTVAVGVIRTSRELGIAVPRELSVVGFDDIPLAELVDPALTTVRQPKRELGAHALDLLIGLLEDGAVARRERLSGELVERASTAPVRRAPPAG